MRPVLAGVEAGVEVTLRVQGGVKGIYKFYLSFASSPVFLLSYTNIER